MSTVFDIIKTILPKCCNPRDTGWDLIPAWPPDLFAVTATITDRSGLYTDPIFNSHWLPGYVCDTDYRGRVTRLAERWQVDGKPPVEVQEMWNELVRTYPDYTIDDISELSHPWKRTVYELLAVADEACSGIGFLSDSAEGDSPGPSEIYRTEYEAWWTKHKQHPSKSIVGGINLLYLPHSLCLMVDPTVACVQPKACTTVSWMHVAISNSPLVIASIHRAGCHPLARDKPQLAK